MRPLATASRSYSRDVATTSRLAPDEQEGLARRFATQRSPEDRRRLVLANLRLVIAIAKSLSGGAGRGDFMDLVQEGNAGLIVGIERFDPDRGVSLATYASFWIRAFMLKHLMEGRSAVRATSTREGRRRFFERSLPADVSLDAPVRRDEDGDRSPSSRVLDHLRDDEALRPDDAAEALDGLRTLRRALHSLEPTMDARERAVLSGRLLSDEPVPLRRLGPSLGVSGERVRQLEQGLLIRIRTYIGAGDGGEVRQPA